MTTDENYPERPNTNSRSGCLWNVLTIVVLIGTIIVVGVFLLIYTNPQIALNPFPPPTLPPVFVVSELNQGTPVSTATRTVFPPTWTPTATLVPTITSTPKPVVVFQTSTPSASTPGDLTPTSRPDMPFSVVGTPAAFSRTFIYPGADCNWLGVGGQVLDIQDAPIVGMTVRLGGMLGNNVIDMTGLTGTVLQYGTAGYEFTLSNKPAASHQTLWVQLLDQAGLPLSAKVYFDTFDDCAKNLVLITFRQVR